MTKLLLDQNLSFKLCRQLADLFPGSGQVGQLGMARASDREIWTYAADFDFILVSLDADFAEMAGLLGPPPKVIWLRCRNQPSAGIERLLRRHIDIITTFVQDAETACLELYGTSRLGR